MKSQETAKLRRECMFDRPVFQIEIMRSWVVPLLAALLPLPTPSPQAACSSYHPACRVYWTSGSQICRAVSIHVINESEPKSTHLGNWQGSPLAFICCIDIYILFFESHVRTLCQHRHVQSALYIEFHPGRDETPRRIPRDHGTPTRRESPMVRGDRDLGPRLTRDATPPRRELRQATPPRRREGPTLAPREATPTRREPTPTRREATIRREPTPTRREPSVRRDPTPTRREPMSTALLQSYFCVMLFGMLLTPPFQDFSSVGANFPLSTAQDSETWANTYQKGSQQGSYSQAWINTVKARGTAAQPGWDDGQSNVSLSRDFMLSMAMVWLLETVPLSFALDAENCSCLLWSRPTKMRFFIFYLHSGFKRSISTSEILRRWALTSIDQLATMPPCAAIASVAGAGEGNPQSPGLQVICRRWVQETPGLKF